EIAVAEPHPRYADLIEGSLHLHSVADTLDLVNPSQHSAKHVLSPVVVPEHVLIKVGLKVLGGNRVIDAANPPPEQAPEPLDRVGVDRPIDVDALLVVDAGVPVAA